MSGNQRKHTTEARQRKKTAAITPTNTKASPPVLTPSVQNSDQIASIKVSGDGRSRTLEFDNATPESISRLMAAFGTKDQDFFEGLLTQIAGSEISAG
jgi:hypothetical protein